MKKFNDDGTYQLWLLVDPESGRPLRVPEPGPKIFSEDEVRKLGLSGWDTSRRSGLDFDDAMRLMQKFGPAVVNEVFKRLFLTRGTGPRR